MITFDSLVAGERLLRDRIVIDDGTSDGARWRLIRDLLSEVFRASGIVLEMPDRCPYMPASIASTEHQEPGRLLLFVAESSDGDCEHGFVFHHD
jgi:hypothetical protein